MKVMQKVSVVLILLMIALVSIAVISPITTSLETHSEAIKQLDEEVDMVLKLTAGATGVSAVLTILPDDQCTPIASELAELAKAFLVVLSALYLEKYLISMVGFASFSIIIPAACALWGVGFFAERKVFKTIAYKLAIFALILYVAIPVSVSISSKIYNNYESSFEETLNQAERVTIGEEDANADKSVVERFTEWISNAAMTVVEYVTNLLSRFVDSIAVMLVVSCLIPVLVIFLFWMVVKIIFNINEKGITVIK